MFEVVVGDDGEGRGVFVLELNEDGSFGSSVVGDEVGDELCFSSYSEEVDHALYHDSRAREVGRSLRHCMVEGSVEELSDVEPVLEERAVEEEEREVGLVEEKGTGSDVVGVGSEVEVHSEGGLFIGEEEVQVGEGSLLNGQARLAEGVIIAYYVFSFPIPLALEPPLHEAVDCLRVVRREREVDLLLLYVSDDCSTAGDVVEVRGGDGDIGSEGGQLNEVVVAPKRIPELTVLHKEGLGRGEGTHGGVVFEVNEGVGDREHAVVGCHQGHWTLTVREGLEGARGRVEETQGFATETAVAGGV